MKICCVSVRVVLDCVRSLCRRLPIGRCDLVNIKLYSVQSYISATATAIQSMIQYAENAAKRLLTILSCHRILDVMASTISSIRPGVRNSEFCNIKKKKQPVKTETHNVQCVHEPRNLYGIANDDGVDCFL